MTTISVPRRLFLAPALACAGCLALAARPSLVMPAFAVTLAVGVAAAVGIFFGWYPARQAARLDPIQSLRYE